MANMVPPTRLKILECGARNQFIHWCQTLRVMCFAQTHVVIDKTSIQCLGMHASLLTDSWPNCERQGHQQQAKPSLSRAKTELFDK